METETLVPQQEQTSDESAPALLPWSTPRLMRLNKAADDTRKLYYPTEVGYVTLYHGSFGVS